MLPNSIIVDFNKLSVKGNPLIKPTKYAINYLNNNYLITEDGILYIDTTTSLLNINFAFMNYTFDIVKDFAVVVPIIKGLSKAN